MSAGSLAVAFREREHPLSPEALYAGGECASLILAQLVVASDEQLRALRGVATRDALVLLGPETALPWADGVLYLARDPRAPTLLLPTYGEPTLPLDLLARRITAACAPPPVAVIPGARRLIATGHAGALTREALRVQLQARAEAGSC